MSAANWGTGNYLIVKENYIAEEIAPHVNIPLWFSLCRYFKLFITITESIDSSLRIFSKIKRNCQKSKYGIKTETNYRT